MKITRKVRKSLTYATLRYGMYLARQGNPHTVEKMRQILLFLTKTALPLRKRLAANMKSAGVSIPGLEDKHFERAIDQIIMLAHIFQVGYDQSGCRERFQFDGSFTYLEQAYAQGKGVINIAPHLCGYPVYPRWVSDKIPCTIYLRRNNDARKMWINEAIGRAGGGNLVYPPENATKMQRLQVAINVLREGKMLFITPDTPRKEREGVLVKIFERTAFFPIGVFIMSLRTGAPVVPTFWHWERNVYHIRYDKPIELTRKKPLGNQAHKAMAEWAKTVDYFLHEHPEMWWNWLDKRWTKIIREKNESRLTY